MDINYPGIMRRRLPLTSYRALKVRNNLASGLWKRRYYALRKDHVALIDDLYHRFSGTIKRHRGIISISKVDAKNLRLFERQIIEEDTILSEIAARYNKIRIRGKKIIVI